MQANSLSGTTADGAAYDLYFLPGGEVSYDDSTGARDRGRWWLDPDGEVCVTFTKVDDGGARCYRVEVDGHTVTWQAKAGGQGMRAAVSPRAFWRRRRALLPSRAAETRTAIRGAPKTMRGGYSGSALIR
jgi:hypothetical protein